MELVAGELERLVAEGAADLDYAALVRNREADAAVRVRDEG
jgi:hypothetical protein